MFEINDIIWKTTHKQGECEMLLMTDIKISMHRTLSCTMTWQVYDACLLRLTRSSNSLKLVEGQT